MKTIELTQQGDDKLLHLTIPVEQGNQRYRMVTVMAPEAEGFNSSAWAPEFIEKTYGSIQDESFIRQPQGEHEKRLEFERFFCSTRIPLSPKYAFTGIWLAISIRCRNSLTCRVSALQS